MRSMLNSEGVLVLVMRVIIDLCTVFAVSVKREYLESNIKWLYLSLQKKRRKSMWKFRAGALGVPLFQWIAVCHVSLYYPLSNLRSDGVLAC